jgi:hypothetical protein
MRQHQVSDQQDYEESEEINVRQVGERERADLDATPLDLPVAIAGFDVIKLVLHYRAYAPDKRPVWCPTGLARARFCVHVGFGIFTTPLHSFGYVTHGFCLFSATNRRMSSQSSRTVGL